MEWQDGGKQRDQPSTSPSSSPPRDSRSTYDFTGGGVDRPDFVSDLEHRIDGDVRFDAYTRSLYATDASAYERTPIGVVFPRSTRDVSRLLTYCSNHDVPVLPRGAGTSLGGQAVNRAVVLDFTRYMDDIHQVDPDEGTVCAQPGIRLGDLNAQLERYGLKFAPDPAWAEKSTLGGAVGNNSSGAHSLVYGKTDRYVIECEVVLADGTVTRFGDIATAALEHDWIVGNGDGDGDCTGTRTGGAVEGITDREAAIFDAAARVLQQEETIERAYPTLDRNVSGYNLDDFVATASGQTANLARLLVGSEGTLAIVTEVTVALEPIPPAKSMTLLRYDTLEAALEDVQAILEHEPAAVEVLDHVLLELARESDEFGPLVEEMIPTDTGAVLLVEFYAKSQRAGKQRVADLLADRIPSEIAQAVPREAASDVSDQPHRAVSAEEAHDPPERERFWQLRKSGLPILLSLTTDEKHVSFIEDVAVPPASLPEFVGRCQDILREYGTTASFYGHAGPGCLHIRPLIDTGSIDGVETMATIAAAVTDLVVSTEGSISGEHGDGRARTQWNRKQYGEEVWSLFREVKTAFDPDWLLNPGQVCGYDESEGLPENVPENVLENVPENVPERARMVRLTDHLRFPTGKRHETSNGSNTNDTSTVNDDDSSTTADQFDFEPQLHWGNDNGIRGMVDLCHGCGGCTGPQETTGGIMCPTYRASQEEITSTRGRANALRRAMTGELPADPTEAEFMTEVMDLCIGCKGCLRDCPSGVDMAKLKAELAYLRNQRQGTSRRDRLFANADRVAALANRWAGIAERLDGLPGIDLVQEKVLGIARERDPPPFREESFVEWFEHHEPTLSRADARASVLLFPDTFTNYSYPAVGRAAVRVLEAADVHVQLTPGITDSGRSAYSLGMVEVAKRRAERAASVLEGPVRNGWDVVCLEPSDAVMFQSDYLDLFRPGECERDRIERIGANTYGLCEFLNRYHLDVSASFAGEGTLTYHGHCHQKATGTDHHAVAVLQRAGYDVDVLDSGCCGMAGSFGYEAEHYSMSRAIGAILTAQIEKSAGNIVVAPGGSCRSQIAHLDEEYRGEAIPPHPVEMLANCVDQR